MEEEKKQKMKEEKVVNTEEKKEEKKPEVETSETKLEEKKTAKGAKAKVEKQIVKKEEAVARGYSVQMSKKQGVYICKFIKNKKIDQAINDLELVIKMKKAVPFKGEIPHRKGDIMSGRYPVKASAFIIKILKGLRGNILVNGMDLDKTVIVEASASWASRPSKSGGRKAKRTNLVIRAKEKKSK